VTFTVNYGGADAIVLSAGDVTLNATDTANASIDVSGIGIVSRTVTLSSITGNGTLGISIDGDTASDSAGNYAPAAGPSFTFAVDNTAIAVNIGPPSTALTRYGPVEYVVNYNNASSVTLDTSDITLYKTGTADAILGVSGSGNMTRTVTLSGITGDGTLGFSIGPGTATDASSNSAPPAGPSAITVVDGVAPVITIIGSNPVQIARDTQYTDAGATATDNVDGSLTDNIVVNESAVDTTMVGSYVVTYDVTDTAGNAAVQATRAVNVVELDPTLPIAAWPALGILMLAGASVLQRCRRR
jgi:hypothetical protein